MLRGHIKKALAIMIALVFCIPAKGAGYIPTSRDTKAAPLQVSYELTVLDDYELLSTVGHLAYYYREDRDVIAVTDTRNGYTWKTGLDAAFNSDIDKAVSAAKTDEEKLEAAIPKEDRLNATYIGFANSLVTAEYFDDAFNLQMISSASQEGASSKLLTVDGDPNHRLLEVDFTKIDLQIKLHVYLTDTGIRYEVQDGDIQGEGAKILASFIVTPFLGAAGGGLQLYNPEKKTYDEKVAKAMLPGYIFVPDGAGALMRFQDNTMSLKKYTGSVYGVNQAETTYYYSYQSGAVAHKEPTMPVFGIAHGDKQAAFAAWANDGAQSMEIVVSPEENMTRYSFAYPRFVYNRQIHQVYNRKGEGYFKLYTERNHFDFSMTYQFLAGEGETDGYPADYVGMALCYRQYLLDSGVLTEKAAPQEMPIRLDFVMSDIKKSVLGYSNVIMTTTEDVARILGELTDEGVKNINSGLLGAQKGGITAGKPWNLQYDGSIGSAGDFTRLVKQMREKGVDISFTQDYARINSLQMLLSMNQADHMNSWGIRYELQWDESLPVTEISFAKPQKSAEWLKTQVEKAKKVGVESATIAGMSNILVSHHGRDKLTSQEAVALYQKTLQELDITINAETPNQYLWQHVDRFLNAPVLTTQYIIETDTVPFLQLVLNGTMEVYSPYANFSFYTREDVLRMIDYNVYPSFVLTSEPAFKLTSTNSSHYYSTEYALYKDIIQNVYGEVSATLNQVAGKKWVGREVIQNGVILNTYGDGTRVLINYTDGVVPYGGVDVPPMSAVVIGIAGDRS